MRAPPQHKLMEAARRWGARVTPLLVEWKHAHILAAVLLVWELVACVAILKRVPYTKIDWDAYMEEVAGPLDRNEWDYSELRGETGPLVYPAGFVYIYGALRLLGAADDVRAAQCVFVGVYVLTQALVMATYIRAAPKRMPAWTLLLLCVSKRMHSLYVLRLFNDCWAMLLLYASVWSFACNRWAIGCGIYSLAVSVKMNIFLFAPGLLFLLIEACGVYGAARHISLCALIQLALGAPFLYTNPVAYLTRAFGGFGDLNQQWSVNWKFVPAACFHSRGFVLALLALHLGALGWLAWRRWPQAGGMTSRRPLEAEHVLTVLLTSNFAGVAFSRSLHFQFYTWYWHAVPFLLWRAPRFPLLLKLATFVLLEYAWSYGLDRATGSSTAVSSCMLQLAHVLLLIAIWSSPQNQAQRMADKVM
ncbi:hypothetical protein AB1Y20_003866 [Prymnesium parvum]|uniref:dolichyl-P-Man:Man5GlcNAc2-PP-dolichol alpha-1,3-mannosyltransferase n=1 Tax=Prymnesium parvum TaxID=97485 RepID=A0AB34J7I3_PRYPA